MELILKLLSLRWTAGNHMAHLTIGMRARLTHVPKRKDMVVCYQTGAGPEQVCLRPAYRV